MTHPSKQESSVVPAGERERFEAWADAREYPLAWSIHNHWYTDNCTRAAWSAWKAALTGTPSADGLGLNEKEVK